MLLTGDGTMIKGFEPAESIGQPPPPGLTVLSLMRSRFTLNVEKSEVVAKYPYSGFSIALAVRLIFPAGNDVATLQVPDPSEMVCAKETPPLDNTTVVFGVAVPAAVKFVPEIDWPSEGLVMVTVGAAAAFLGLVVMRGIATDARRITAEKVVNRVFLKLNFLYCFIRINFKALQVKTQVVCVLLRTSLTHRHCHSHSILQPWHTHHTYVM